MSKGVYHAVSGGQEALKQRETQLLTLPPIDHKSNNIIINRLLNAIQHVQ